MTKKKLNPITQYGLKQISLFEMKKQITERLLKSRKQGKEKWLEVETAAGNKLKDTVKMAKDIFGIKE